jgi:hypothetical protein
MNKIYFIFTSQKNNLEKRVLSGLFLCIATVFFWTASKVSGNFFDPQPAGYYGLQVQGFIKGQINAAIIPSPELLALKDPYDPVANAPYRVHDMTLFRGKYYLYFGVAPIILFIYPIGIVAGWYPSEACAVAFFCSVGMAFSLALVKGVRDRYYPKSPGWALLAGSLVLALSHPAARLTLLGNFYEVPIACAFAMHMAMFYFLFLALNSENKRSALMMVLASIFYGLTIASRPNYFLSGFALVVPWVVYIRKKSAWGFFRKFIFYGAAAFGPAVLIGFSLLIYNKLRFGSFGEFGMAYQLAGERVVAARILHFDHFKNRFSEYLAGGMHFTRYFPFLYSYGDKPAGVLIFSPWLWFIPAAFIISPQTHSGARVATLVALGVSCLCNFAILTIYWWGLDRYVVDYEATALIISVVGVLALADFFRKPRAFICTAFVFGVFSIVSALGTWIKRFPDPKILSPIARIANTPIQYVEALFGAAYGGIKLELKLPEEKSSKNSSEPIFETGIAGDQRDWLQIDYLNDNQARLAFFHAGLGMFRGQVFKIPANRIITVEVECSSLLPPATHPIFKKWSSAEYDAVRRMLVVRLDGQTALHAALDCYDATADDLRIGRFNWPVGGVRTEFTGAVLNVSKFPMRRPLFVADGHVRVEPLSLKLWFPVDKTGRVEPLVSTGNKKLFDMVLCHYTGPSRLSLSLYHHGDEPIISPEINYDPLSPHTLQIWMGSLADLNEIKIEDGYPEKKDRLVLIFDGKVVIDRIQAFYPALPISLIYGRNDFITDLMDSKFSGQIDSVTGFDYTSLPKGEFLRNYGTVEMLVKFSSARKGAAEPLVVSGVSGAGDFLYIKYLEDDRVVFGYDHWGVGGFLSDVVPIDISKRHRLRLSMGSLYPVNAEAGPWRQKIKVMLDDIVVLSGVFPAHPSDRKDIVIGENFIGGSSCGPKFSGRIFELVRSAQPTW